MENFIVIQDADRKIFYTEVNTALSTGWIIINCQIIDIKGEFQYVAFLERVMKNFEE